MGWIKNIFTHHKMKFLILFLGIVVFTVVFFPFSDLSDAITSEVSAQTNNQVYLQFDELSLGFAPQLALKMQNVLLEGPALPLEITLKNLMVAPSLLSLIRQQIGGKVVAEGLYNGEVVLNVSKSNKLQAPESLWADFIYEGFDLKDFTKALQKTQGFPFTATGSGQIKATIDVDPTIKQQPDGTVEVTLNKPQIPTFTISNPQTGEIPLPAMSFEKVVLKGRLKDGKIIISDSILGTNKDDLFIKISGELNLQLAPGFQQVAVSFYNLALDITIKEAFQNQMGKTYMALLDGFLGKFKSGGTAQTRYAFRIEGRGFDDPFPRYSPL